MIVMRRRFTPFTRTVRTSVKSEDGVRTVVEKQQRVAPWWVQVPDGSFLFTIRSGWRPIEFDKGKSAIVVLSEDKLPAIIETLITAVRSGELDEHLDVVLLRRTRESLSACALEATV